MHKHLIAIAAAATAALSLTACGSGASGSGAHQTKAAAQPSNPADLKANITYAIWGSNETAAAQKVVADFNKTYPNVHVSVQTAPYASYWTKLQTEAKSKTLPDVFWMNGPNFQLYAAGGMLQPMTGLIDNKKIDPADYPKSLNELYTYDGVEYGAPKDFDTIAVLVNKQLFQQAGVPLPKAGWTWSDFNRTVSQLRAKLKPQNKFAVDADLVNGGQQAYYNTIAQAGGYVISPDEKKSGYDTPAGIKGLKFWSDLVANGSMPTLAQQADTAGLSRFLSGTVAMFWDGDWDVKQIADSPVGKNLTVVPLPKDVKQATIIHGLANVISSSTSHRAAAEAFVTYLAGQQAAQTWAKEAGVIPAYNGGQQDFLSVAPGANLQVFLDGAKNYAVPYPISKNTDVWANAEGTILPPGFSGQQPMDQVAKQMAATMNKALAKEK